LLLFLTNSYLIKSGYDFLAFKDNPGKADIIIVLSGDIAGDRVPKAAELFTAGYADRIMVIGSKIQ